MLQLDAGHHTLTCAACGAPLRQLKMLPAATPQPRPAVTHQQPTARLHPLPKAKYAKPSKPRKKRKSLFRKFAEEAFDLVEDIFD
jgi:hypothetical protein